MRKILILLLLVIYPATSYADSLGNVINKVYEKAPLSSDHKLRFLPNALLLPHLGDVTAENYSIFYTQMIENLEACVNGKPIRVIK